MAQFVDLDVSQKLTSICVVDETGRRLWRGQCRSEPEPIDQAVRRHAGGDVSIAIESGPMTPWLVHALRKRGRRAISAIGRPICSAPSVQIAALAPGSFYRGPMFMR